MTAFLFYVFAFIAVTGAVALVSHRNPVYSALSLVVTMFCLAALFAMQGAQFLAILQILVYAGAIMVLFLFVIMLINIRSETRLPNRFTRQSVPAIVLGVLLLAEIVQLALRAPSAMAPVQQALDPKEVGRTQTLAGLLFTKYLLPFEVASVLLLVAIVGGVFFAKRRLR